MSHTPSKSLQYELIKTGSTQFKTPKVEVNFGQAAIFTKVARLTVLRGTNEVILTSFTLDLSAVVISQNILADLSIAEGQAINFRMEATNRGLISRANAYWHTTYPPTFISAVGRWPQPFLFEYAGYDNNQNGQFYACQGYAGDITRKDPHITTTMHSTNVVLGTNSISYAVWDDNEVVHLVL